MELTDYRDAMLAWGAAHAAVIPVTALVFDREFRRACEANTCGNYGRCWTCPPDAGDIDDLMAEAQSYRYALVYQTISPLEDSYDIEGMGEAAVRHNRITQKLQRATENSPVPHLHLGAGGCRVCERCARADDQPCRHPDIAIASLETYGIYVTKLAEAAGMKYVNGVNTVTFFGALLWEKRG